MRKYLFVLVAMLAATVVFAQVNSVPGAYQWGPNGTGGSAGPHFNVAHRQIDIVADLPNQVSFTIPQATFGIDLSQVNPGSTINIQIEVKNQTDRPIVVSDYSINGTLDLGVMTVSAGSVSIPVGQTKNFVYAFVLPDVETINTAIQGLTHGWNGSFFYNSSTNVLTVRTALEATGQFPQGHTTFDFNLP